MNDEMRLLPPPRKLWANWGHGQTGQTGVRLQLNIFKLN